MAFDRSDWLAAAIIMQSNPYNTQSMVQAFKDHFTEATYRDIASFELKTFEDTVTEVSVLTCAHEIVHNPDSSVV